MSLSLNRCLGVWGCGPRGLQEHHGSREATVRGGWPTWGQHVAPECLNSHLGSMRAFRCFSTDLQFGSFVIFSFLQNAGCRTGHLFLWSHGRLSRVEVIASLDHSLRFPESVSCRLEHHTFQGAPGNAAPRGFLGGPSAGGRGAACCHAVGTPQPFE